MEHWLLEGGGGGSSAILVPLFDVPTPPPQTMESQVEEWSKEVGELQAQAAALPAQAAGRQAVGERQNAVGTRIVRLIEPLKERRRILLASKEVHQVSHELEDEVVSTWGWGWVGGWRRRRDDGEDGGGGGEDDGDDGLEMMEVETMERGWDWYGVRNDEDDGDEDGMGMEMMATEMEVMEVGPIMMEMEMGMIGWR